MYQAFRHADMHTNIHHKPPGLVESARGRTGLSNRPEEPLLNYILVEVGESSKLSTVSIKLHVSFILRKGIKSKYDYIKRFTTGGGVGR